MTQDLSGHNNRYNHHKIWLYSFLLLLTLLLCPTTIMAQNSRAERMVRDRVTTYFTSYHRDDILVNEKIKVQSVGINTQGRELTLTISDAFGMVPFTDEQVSSIYKEVQQLLPQPYNAYTLHILTNGHLLEDLVVGGDEQNGETASRLWGDISYKGNAWVTPLNRPYHVDEGLPSRHISVWASHGRYFDLDKNEWKWQRPRLFCATEDLLSQTIVIPLLIPMLENAGAIVFTPRERNWQKNEAVVDNDTPNQSGLYTETNGQYGWLSAGTGFAHTRQTYINQDNPFTDGTARLCATQTRRSQSSTITWTPQIPADGQYAVYVSYKTIPTSIPDAEYTVRHRGQNTRFRVNQQMGGGTWVYLGTFDFAAGESTDNCVRLTNQSNYRGHVTADAVRFGGGMGNVARGVGGAETVSGMPRFLEAARYYAQWAGMPSQVYANIDSVSDYREDINTRSLMTNYLAGGSPYLPADSGLHVPIDLTVALHTDAGITSDGSPVGTLAIYHSHDDDGLLPSGISRLTCRDLADMVQTQVCNDLEQTLSQWTRRQLWDKNYSECRRPQTPSLLLEMLSHQNFPEMVKAHDPYFKFLLARALYKGILRYEAYAHGQKHVTVQPLPVTAPQACVMPDENEIRLTWTAVDDPLEATAKPTAFVVYHAEGQRGYDNGTLVRENSYTLREASRNVLHRFKVSAVNDGGQSLLSEEVCAYISNDNNARQILIVDAFDRMAGPRPIISDTIVGFDMTADMGIPMAQMPGYCGLQVDFNPLMAGQEGEGALGHSIGNLEGMILAGNTRDWTTRHALDIIAATNGLAHISSCTAAALEAGYANNPGSQAPNSYNLMDIACGLQQRDGYSLIQHPALSYGLRQAMAACVRAGGNLLVSGSYIGSDAHSDEEQQFLRSVLKTEHIHNFSTTEIQNVFGLGSQFSLETNFSERSYRVSRADCLAPTENAFCAMIYQPSQECAAVAYQGQSYRSMTLGFPWESITDNTHRVELMRGIFNFLLP
ncbi:MAG: N-acetylmuramoyl-L-alanine amidase [Bacteroidaceae bacterium]|nr:N-acetylmuramoyl-L-alanine amidase [Bacteroidaceae bacterium]